MKTQLRSGLLLASVIATSALAQDTDITNQMQNAGYTITERGQHHRVWSQLAFVTNSGVVSLVTNTITQLSTGLHRSVSNQWVVSTPQIVLTSTGIVARGASHTALFATNANTYGAITMKLPDGQILRSHLLGLAYHDNATGSNLMFAVLKDSTAQIIGNKRVAYPSAFDGASASIVYSYTKAGLSQDIVFYEKPPVPSEFGLNDETSHLLVITEFVTAPNPQIASQDVPAGLETITDQTLDFSSMQMIPGKAYFMGTAGRREGVPVFKTWALLSGRRVLIERLQFPRVREQVVDLPDEGTSTNSPLSTITNASVSRVTRWFANNDLPAAPSVNGNGPSGPVKLIASLPARNAFIVDYDVIMSSNPTFEYGHTYLIDGATYISTATFYAGSVLKYNPGASLNLSGAYTFTEYGGDTMAIMTSWRDDARGLIIPGSTGNPQNGDYGPALTLPCTYAGQAAMSSSVWYASPTIQANPACGPTVTVTANDPAATKNASPADNGQFTISRAGGSWTSPLTVYVSLSGTARPLANGVGDYTAINSPVTIPANAGSVTVDVTPTTQSSPAFESTVILTIVPSVIRYNVGSATTATVYIADPAYPVTGTPIPAPAGLIGWWRAEGNGINDASTTDDGQFLNGLGSAPGFNRQSLKFGGSPHRFQVSSPNSLNFGANQNYSIEAWIRPLKATTDYGIQSVVDHRYAPNDYTSYGYEFPIVNGKVACQIGVSGSAWSVGQIGPDLRDGKFHHIALTVVRNTTGNNVVTFFADGQQLGTFNNPPTGDLSTPNQATQPQYLRIGNHATDYHNCYFSGFIDEVAIYNQALSASDILAIYNAGRAGKCVAPFNITQSSGQIITYGSDTAPYSASLRGGPVSYQWRKNGTPIPGATFSTCTVIKPWVGDSIDMVVSSVCASPVTVQCPLTVNRANMTITANSISKATGSANPGFTYTPSGLISGDSIIVGYLTAATTTSPAGSYNILPTLTAANGLLANYNITINSGTLTVIDAPSIIIQPASTSTAVGISTVFRVTATGSSLTYQWSRNGTDIANATASSFTISPASTDNGAVFKVLVANSVGSLLSSGATLSIDDPIITRQPVSKSVVPGSAASFDVLVASSAPGFQWRKDGANISDISGKRTGTASSAVSISSVIANSDSGAYSVQVQNASHSVVSAPATLSVCLLYPLAISSATIAGHLGRAPNDVISANFGTGTADFGWISWINSPSDQNLMDAWTDPLGKGTASSPIYNNPDNASDHLVAQGKKVKMVNGAKANIVDYLYQNNLVGPNAQPVTVLIWDAVYPTSNPDYYIVRGFATIRIRSIGTTGSSSSMTFEYLGLSPCLEAGHGNTAPDVTFSSSLLIYTENDPPKVLDPLAKVVDYDSADFDGGSLSVDLSAAGLPEDAISVNNQGFAPGQIGLVTLSGITYVTYGNVRIATNMTYLDRNKLTLNFNASATREAVQALLCQLTYHNTSDNPSESTRTLQLTLNDGDGGSTARTKPIQVRRVNDQPTLATIPDVTIVAASGSHSVLLSGITAGGGESQNLSISAASDNTSLIANPTIKSASNPSAAYSSPASAAVLNFSSGVTTLGTVTISVNVHDDGGTDFGGVDQITRTFHINLVAPNSTGDIPPTITVSPQALAYKEKDPATPLDTTADISDPDSPDFKDGVLTVRFISNGLAEDELAVRPQSPIGISGNQVTFNGSVFGNLSLGSGTLPLTVTFTATSATIPVVRELLRNLTYHNSSQNASPLSRVVQISMTDGDGGTSLPVTKTINLTGVNDPPIVNAGPDQSITLPQSPTIGLQLGTSVSDPDGPINPPIVSWSKVSGPGSVRFKPVNDANIAHIQAWFSSPGDYTLRLSASDSQLSAYDDVVVHVTLNSSTPNAAPIVSAGPNQNVSFPDWVYLPGTVSDDGFPIGSSLTVTWTKDSGPGGGTVTFDDFHSAATVASFSVAGTYVLRLTASDGDKTAFSTVTITVAPVISATEFLHNVDVVSTGVGSLKTFPARTMTLQGVVGVVKKAYLYWHGPTDTSAADANSFVFVNGRLITGRNLGFAEDNRWLIAEGHSYANSQSYRADVTALVSAYGNGEYVLQGFNKCTEVAANGASLVVFFDNPTSTTKHDVVLWQGNDSNFGLSFLIDGPVNATALKSDGRIFVVGGFNDVNNQNRNYIAQLLPDGSLDNSFDPGLGVEVGSVNAVVAQSDGKVIIGGDFTAFDGTPRNSIARISPNGAIDNAFNPGSGCNGAIRGLAIQPPDGKIVLVGDFTSCNGVARNRIARLNSDGSVDTSFNPGIGADGGVYCLALQQDGKIVIGGAFANVAGVARSGIARLNQSGALDSTFNPGTGTDYPVQCIAVEASGNILIGGYFLYVNSNPQQYIARLNANGTLDPSFSSIIPDNNVLSICIQSSGKILIGGTFTHVNSTPQNNISRLNSDGTLDSVNFKSGLGADGWIDSIVQETSGNILIGGNFGSYDGQARSRFARLDVDGKIQTVPPDPEWHTTIPIANFPSSGSPVASLELHVSDGQYLTEDSTGHIEYFSDPSLFLNGSLWWAPEAIQIGCEGFTDTQLFAGNYGATGIDDCRGLWDIKERSITSFLVPGAQNLSFESRESSSDNLALIAALAKLPPGSAPADTYPAVSLPPNQVVVAHGDTVMMPRGIRTRLIDVLGNDVVPPGTLISISAVSTPLHGTAESVLGGSAVLYTVLPGFSGTDMFTYTAIDTSGNSSTATVSVQVNGNFDPTMLHCGQPLSGTLGTSGETTSVRGGSQPADYYRFEGTGGSSIALSALTSTFHSHIYLRDPLGRLVASGSHRYPYRQPEIRDSPITYTLPSTGTYTVEVTSHSLRESGSYTLSLEMNGNSECIPQPNLEIWADGIQIPNGGSIDFGVDSSKTVTILNTGKANLQDDPGVSADSPFTCNVDTLSPLPITPNSSRSVIVSVSQGAAGSKSGQLHLGSYSASLHAYVNPSGALPSVTLSSPPANSSYYVPTSVPIVASATPVSGTTISKVEFFAATGYGKTKIGESTATPYSITWRGPSVGSYILTASATDSAGHVASSVPVAVTVAIRPPNLAPIAADDNFTIFMNTQSQPIDPLANDTDPNGDTLTIVSAAAQYGGAVIPAGGKTILYTPLANSFGTDIIDYTISDGHNATARAKVYVTILQTTVSLTSPQDAQQFAPGDTIPLAADASTSDGAIARVDFLVNNEKVGQKTIPPYTATWSTVSPGVYSIKAVSFDTKGFSATSDIHRIRVGTGTDRPIAEIANLVDGQIIREGRFDLNGTADNDNAGISVTYQVLIYRPDDGQSSWNQRLVADLTPASTQRTVNNLLAHLDFSQLRNGAYILELKVNGALESVSQQARFILESNLKVGQFTFNEQDLVIPANGIPLTVIRTYNSGNPNARDFGYSWTFAINDLEMEIDEERALTEDSIAEPPEQFSMRVGGGRDITLTLPDGRRTTFSFYLDPGICNDGDPAEFCYYAKWQAPPGVTAKLTADGDTRLVCLFGGLQYWSASPDSGIDNFDFPAFTLETLEGTKYQIQRDASEDTHDYGIDGIYHSVKPYGKAKLVQITARTGERTAISDNSITFFAAGNSSGTPTRSVTLERDSTQGNRITAIRDGLTATGSRQAVRYIYDNAGNLSKVRRLVKINAASDDLAYNDTTYIYNDPIAPRPELAHYITQIQDARGLPVARNKYDLQGQLVEVTDANGKVTTFEHDLDGRKEVITNPLKERTVHFYDDRGNIVSTIDPLSHITSRSYDSRNNVLSETDALGHTTTHTYNDLGLVLTTTDPLHHTISFSYDSNGNLLTATDGRGNITRNSYDSTTGNLLTMTQTLNVGGANQHDLITVYNYNADKLPTLTIDPVGNRAESTYDSTGNLLSVAAEDSAGTKLTETVYAEPGVLTGGYDANGNKLVERLTRILPDSTSQTIITRYQYDSQNRLVATILPENVGGSGDYITGTTYNSIGKAETTTDMYGRVTYLTYDPRGNLVQTKYPDNRIVRTVYDDLGRAVITTDRHDSPASGSITTANGSRTIYDPSGRVIRTERLQDIITDLVASSGGGAYSSLLQDPPPAVLSASATDYDDAGRVKASTDGRGYSSTYGYDDANRRTSIRDAIGNVTTFGYDENGNQTSVTDALGRATTYQYDELNRQTSVTPPAVTADGGTVARATTTYDDAGRRIAQTDLAGVTTGFAYDAAGRLTSVKNALGTPSEILTRYVYDAAGNMTQQIDAENRTTLFEYDKLARRTKRTLPGTPVVSEFTEYQLITRGSAKALRKKITDFAARIVYQTFDEMDRLEKKIVGNDPLAAPTVSFSYYANGQRQTMLDPSGSTTYYYDAYNHLSSKVAPLGTWNYDRDVKGNILGINFHDFYSVSYYAGYSWDPVNRLESVKSATTGDSSSTAYIYTTVGNLDTVTNYFGDSYPTSYSLSTAYHYDERNRLTDMAVTRTSHPDEVSTSFASFNYNPSDRRLGRAGNRMAARETINGMSRSVNYDYDPLYRLTLENITAGVTVGSISYANGGGYVGYDKVGNRRSRNVSAALRSGALTDFSNASLFDSKDHLTTSTYDNNGNTTVETLPSPAISPTTAKPDEYDFENRLTKRWDASTTVQMIYDGDGNRVRKTVNGVATYFLVDDQNPSGYAQVLAELRPDQYGHVHFSRKYLYGHSLIRQTLFDPISYFPTSISYFGSDGHGNVRFLVKDDGTLTDTYNYDAFGILIEQTPAIVGQRTPNRYLYCGEQFDSDLGLYVIRARYMSPNDGRFWSVDTFEGDHGDPFSLHKYLYAANNPVNLVDPSGYKFTPLEAAAIGREVHTRVSQHFLATTPPGQIRVTAQSVFTMLRLPNPPSGGAINGVSRLFPDLVDLTHKEVYEIKPLSVGGVAGGIVQLTGYLAALNTLDPTGGWGVAIAAEHYNSFNVFMTAKPFAIITVAPPVLGVIFYDAVAPSHFVGKRAMNVATANNARLQQQTGIATLLGLLGGI